MISASGKTEVGHAIPISAGDACQVLAKYRTQQRFR